MRNSDTSKIRVFPSGTFPKLSSMPSSVYYTGHPPFVYSSLCRVQCVARVRLYQMKFVDGADFEQQEEDTDLSKNSVVVQGEVQLLRLINEAHL